MIVSRKSIDDFTLQLSALGDEAEAEMASRLAKEWRDLRPTCKPGANGYEEQVEVAREALFERAASILDSNDASYGSSSSSLGLRFFGDTLETHAGDADSVDVTAVVRRSNRASALHWSKLINGEDEGFEKFLRGVCAKTRRNVTHMADRASAGLAVTINGRRKGAGIRFARIPNGPSCGFCTMLASRGFVYASRKSAGEYTRFHDHCDCRIVAGTKDTQVEGYDPEGMYRRYRMCRDSLGTLDDVWRDWEALPDEEKDKYGDAPRIPVFSDPEKQRELERSAGKNADAFNDYYAHRITAEMDARDREWLYTGTCEITRRAANPRAAHERIAHPEAYEEWQNAVTLVRRLKSHPNLLMHIKDSKPWLNVMRQSNRALSYFEVDGDDDTDKATRLRDAIDALAGTGYPAISLAGNWQSTEIVVGMPYTGYDALANGREANAAKIHYSMGRRKLVHVVPQYNRAEIR